MKISEFARNILEVGDLNAKLLEATDISFDTWSDYSCPKLPSRVNKLKVSTENVKFPKGHFHLADKKALAIHSFANLSDFQLIENDTRVVLDHRIGNLKP